MSLPACSFEDLALRNLDCPCGTGWVCDTDNNVCIKTADLQDGSIDVNVDRVQDARLADRMTDLAADRPPTDTSVDSGLDGGLDAGPDSSPDVGTDVGSDSGMDPCLGALFCEDFETALLPGWRRGENVDATSEVSSIRSVAGSSSLRSEVLVAGGRSYWFWRLPEIVTSGNLHVRMHTYLPEAVYTNITPLSIGQSGAPFDSISTKFSDGLSGIFSSIDSQFYEGTALQTDRWQCWEVVMGVSDTTGTISIAIDGVAHLAASGLDTLPDAGWSRINAGVVFSSLRQVPAAFFIDDLAVSRSPLPCE